MSQPEQKEFATDLELILDFLRDDAGYFSRLRNILSNFSPFHCAELFRIAHTVKGIAMSLGLVTIGEAAHELESRLDGRAADAIQSAGERLLAAVAVACKDYAPRQERVQSLESSVFEVEVVGREGSFILPGSFVKRVLFRPLRVAIPNASAVVFEGRLLTVTTQYADLADWVLIVDEGSVLKAVAVSDVRCVILDALK